MNKRLIGSVGGLMVLLCLLLVTDSLGRLGRGVFDQIDLLVDVRHEIVSSYVEEPDEEKMVEDAVRAMVASLEDRYTVFLAADELEPFDKQIRGSFSGIGAEIDIHNDRLRIVSPLEDSPAWNAGVMAGDIILDIDGESTEGITITEAVNQLTGPEGTDVTVKVRHESGDEQEIVITRARINVQTVRGFRRDEKNHWVYMLDSVNDIGYVRITQFTSNTAPGVAEALRQLSDQDLQGLILDLRFNPGGLLESAVAVSDFFLDPEQRVVSVKGRRVPERVFKSSDKTTIRPVPIVVLANEASASASEIVTGALSDNKRAKFIGSRTFGKGSVQQVKMLESGLGALKMTHAHYYLPNGRNIHRREGEDVWGVDPDDGFYVPMSSEQVRKMIEIRRDRGLLRADNGQIDLPDQMTPQWIEDEMADLQLAAGLRALLGKLDQGDWPEVGESGAEELVRQTMRDNLIRQRDLLNERLVLVSEELAKLDNPESDEDLSDADTDAEAVVAQEDETPTDQEPVEATAEPSEEAHP